jgi:GT2 family glycosyltransferase
MALEGYVRDVSNTLLVSVIVVTWNSAATIVDLLDSLAAKPPDVSCEVLVVDNASGDETVQLASRHPTAPRVLVNRQNRGLAAANNQGMLAASGDYFLICNPDVVLQPGCVDALVACMARHPRAAFALARLLHPDGTLQRGVGDLPTIAEALRGRGSAHRRSETSGWWWDGWAHDEERQVGHGNEACYLVRRTAVSSIGLQDERYTLDWEGLDWSARAAASGWQVWFCPSAVAIHVGGVSIRQAPRARWVMTTHRGMYRYFASRSPAALRPVLAGLVGARMIAKIALSAFQPRVYDRAHRGR